MTRSEQYLAVLRQKWGYENFRGIQADIIESIGSGRDTLGLMPTGGGKSITFQVPALCMPGTCLVVTPLIALMNDQVRQLRAKGIKATAIHSDMPHEQCVAALENCILGDYKFLYVSPERLFSQFFVNKLRHLEISFIAVDEAHCICQWGYDFRPAYTQIATFRAMRPNVPVLALTATATPAVVEDIQRQLSFPEPNVHKMSFKRKNLAYIVQRVGNKHDALLQLLHRHEGSVIIYMRNRLKCKGLAEMLTAEGFSATFFHAALNPWEKNERQEAWQQGKIRIMVATNAFGMGINKENVRLVVHMDLPDSIEEYFQEAGRAGRDGEKASSIIIIDGSEFSSFLQRAERAFPAIEFIRNVYESLCCFFQLAVGDGFNVTRELRLEEFCRIYKYYPTAVHSALDLLDKAGYIRFEEADEGVSRLLVTATRNALLQDLTGDEEQLVMCMFRQYGGLFVDYTFIDESFISHETGLDVDFIYQTLTELNRRNLVRYIPRKHTPKVTFCQRRVDKEDITLPRHIYDERKKCLEERLTAMYRYCTSTDDCRSQQLLCYFGEEGSKPCGVCDVCLEMQPYTAQGEEAERIRQSIVQQLSQRPRHAHELDTTGYDLDTFWLVLDNMYKKEEIEVHDFLFHLTAAVSSR